MAQIRKNLSDADMFKGWKEESSFETETNTDHEQVKGKRIAKSKKAETSGESFFTDELREKVGKALLELKVSLYNEGIIDYELKVERKGHQIVLNAVPKEVKKEQQQVHEGKTINRKR